MAKQQKETKALTVLVAQRVQQVFAASLGYELEKVECQLLDSSDLLITIERAPSATESFLQRQHQSKEALNMGLTINRILKDKLVVLLAKEFGLVMTEISLLESADPYRFSFFILLERSWIQRDKPANLNAVNLPTERSRDIAL